MSVGEICDRNVVTIHQNQDLEDAVSLMRSEHVGDVVVVEERGQHRHPVGILTDRDVLVKVLGKRLSLDDADIADVMSFDLITALESESVDAALERMNNYGVRRLPVVNRENHLVGILSLDDVIRHLARQVVQVSNIIASEQAEEERRIQVL